MKSFGTYVFNFGNDHSYEKNLNWNEWNMYTVTYDTHKVGFLNGKSDPENTLDPTTVGWKNEKYKINGKLTPLGEIVKGIIEAAWEDTGGATIQQEIQQDLLDHLMMFVFMTAT